ncbi:MAG: hypothetical protein MJ192_03740 [Clostridia bacterium]|nr:hypothetical protein [Clostridia bacterium]
MGILDYVLLVLIAGWAVGSVVWIISRLKKGKCCGCSSCGDSCVSCDNRNSRESRDGGHTDDRCTGDCRSCAGCQKRSNQ